jgi:UDP-N-acetylmuramoyl-L-alanyl-D-glutamate--2,6-diaminopimelate ligase
MSARHAAGAPISLSRLLEGIVPIDAARSRVAALTPVADLTLDSREVRPGTLFFALAGRRHHGLEFAAEAARRGASVILWESATGLGEPVLADGVIGAPVHGLSRLLGRIADRFFGFPSQHQRLCGFTGTNGKTTCAYLLAQSLGRLGSSSAYIGTLGLGRVGALASPTHTTPDVIHLHRTLAELHADGVRDVALEVSSHALDQGRVDAVRFHTAAFTNLTRDHLDYHGTMEAYGDAKALLFERPELAHIVLNIGDAFGASLRERAAADVPVTAVWVGEPAIAWAERRHLRVASVKPDVRGLSLTLSGSYGPLGLHSPLIGRFNAENLVVVLACLLGLGVPGDQAVAALAGCAAAPGRMQLVAAVGEGRPLAVIDYAHTPDALAKALRAVREHCRGLLWCVFGCGGDRDPGKRPIMGAIAAELADRIIVTDDNPRGEDPAEITAAIVAGIGHAAVRVIHDRGAAIAAALTEASAGDWVLIAGKGHEDYQIYGESRRAFSDSAEAERLLGVAA